MTKPCFSSIANILSTMPSQNAWDDKVASVYALAMATWRDDIAMLATVTALKTKNFRPTPAELRHIALRCIHNMTPMTAMNEISEIIRKYQLKDRDSKCTASLKAIVDACGGWSAIGNRDRETNAKMVNDVFDDVMNTIDTSDVLSNPPDIPELEGVRGLIGNGTKKLT